MKLNEIVISRDGKEQGKTTGGERACTMEGCRGHRVGVKWPDNRVTFPCTAGMVWDATKQAWQIQ